MEGYLSVPVNNTPDNRLVYQFSIYLGMKYLLLLITVLWAQALSAQATLPIIRATSKQVSIRDGDYLDKNTWNLSPKARPDIYTADRARKAKWVTFYTDIDSIRVKLRPGARFDFIILFNGDSCYTEIASALPGRQGRVAGERVGVAGGRTAGGRVTHDTIPFTLTDNSAICVKSIINDSVTLNLHFDVSSFGVVLLTPNYKKFKPITKVQLGPLSWTNPRVLPAPNTATGMDGRFGWDLFEGKCVEIDYDHHLLIIHSKLPRNLNGYTRSRLDFLRSYPCAKATIIVDKRAYTGDFMFDTGSDRAVFLDSNWAVNQHFPSDLRLLSTSVMHDGAGRKYENKIVEAPLLTFDGYALTDIPAWLLGGRNPAGFSVNLFGNDLLKRFNMVLDFQNDRLYLKPNGLMHEPFKGNS
jgi:hypothetical protein